MKVKTKEVKKMVESAIAMLEEPGCENKKALQGLVQFQDSICDFQDNLLLDLSQVLCLLAQDVADPENESNVNSLFAGCVLNEKI